MKKIILIIFIFLFCYSPLKGEVRKITVGSDNNYPPYEYINEKGEPAGYNIDLIKAIGKELDLDIVIKPAVWSDLRKSFDRGEVEVLSGMFYDESRLKSIEFSVPHSIVNYAIFIRKDNTEIKSEKDLFGKTILAQNGDIAYENFLAKNYSVKGVASPEEAVSDVSAGKADCAVISKTVGLYFINRRNIENLKITGNAFFPRKYCFAVRKENSQLLMELNEALFVLKEKGVINELYHKNLGVFEERETFSSSLKRVMFILLPVVIALMFMSFWSWSLNKMVKKKTISLEYELNERKKAEDALRKSELKFRTLFESASDGILIMDKDKFIDCNEKILIICGAEREEIIGHSPFDFSSPIQKDGSETKKKAWNKINLALEGKPQVFEWISRRKDGTCIETEVSLTRLELPEKTYLLAIVRDITERKKSEEEKRNLEKQIQHSQKLESLGVLAGGIAHDFNNLLVGIMGYTELARMDIPSDSPVQSFLSGILKSAKGAAELCRQMLAYSGRGQFVIQNVKINNIVKEMVSILEVSISKKVKLQYNFEEILPDVEADVSQLKQIIMNLIINASDAIGDKTGLITVSTGSLICDEAYLTSGGKTLPEGLYVYIDVTDNGCGMDKETLSKIFEPFFTTKFTGRGLGLAAVLGIIRGHRGLIKVESEKGIGTTFRVLLPCAEKKEEVLSVSSTDLRLTNSKGTILFVDDEAVTRTIGKKIIERMGLKAITAENGVKAIEIFQERFNQKIIEDEDKIICVILDLTMPEMDGMETFQELYKIDPHVPVILSSGYSEQEIDEKFLGKEIAGFIHKPYEFHVFSEKITQILNI